MANGFNEYFTNIGPNVASSIDDSNTSFRLFVKPAKSKLDRFKLVSVSRVIKLLNVLSNCKAAGLDKISGRILKVAANSIAPSLTHIFNHGLISNNQTVFQMSGKWHGLHQSTRKGLEI